MSMMSRGASKSKKVAAQQHKASLKAQAAKYSTSSLAMQKDLFYGSKCDKPASLRRPFKGGTVCR